MRLFHPKRYLIMIFGTITVLLGIVGTINFAVDPMQYYRRMKEPVVFADDFHRYLTPGLIRNYDYNAIVVGSSHTGNVYPSYVKELFGWDALKCTIPGSDIEEQSRTLEMALKTGKVEHVIWCLDAKSFYNPMTKRLPMYLYEPDWTTHCQYLLSLDTLDATFKIWEKDGAEDLDMTYEWHHRAEYDESLVWTTIEERRQLKQADYLRRYEKGQMSLDTMLTNAEIYVLSLILQYPDVDFKFYWPPNPIVNFEEDFFVNESVFETRQAFRLRLSEWLINHPNTEIYDFQSLDEFTHDLDRYWDFTHFHKDISDYAIRSIAENRHKLTRENVEEEIGRLSEQVYDFRKYILKDKLAQMEKWEQQAKEVRKKKR